MQGWDGNVALSSYNSSPIIVQGEWKDEKEKERLIEVCCKACVGRYSGVATVSVGGQVGVACMCKGMVMSWLLLYCNSSK